MKQPLLFVLAASVSVLLLTPPAGAEVLSSDSRTTITRLPPAGRVIPLPNRVRLLARKPPPARAEPLPALPAPLARPDTTPAAIDDRPFWAAIARGDLAGARVIHKSLQATGQPWPEARRALDLLTLLQAEADFKQAAAARDWTRIIALADRQPTLVSCDRAYNFWPLAEAYQGLGRAAELTSLYQGVVGACSNENDRLTAIEHAFERLPSEAVADLLLREQPYRRSAAGDQRLDNLQYRLNGTRLVASLDDPANGGEAADIEDAMGPAVLARQDRAAAVSLGWSNFRTGRLAKAEQWFRTALQWSPDPDAAEGLANTLLRRDLPAQAATVVDDYLGQDQRAPSLRRRIHAALAGRALADGAFDTALTQVAAARDFGAAGPGMALVEGWALLQSERPQQALLAFAAAVELGGGDDAVFGQIRAFLALDRLDDAQSAAAALPPSVSGAIVAEISIRLADRAFKQRRYDAAIIHAQRAQASPDFAVDALALEAWARFRQGDLDASQTLFEWLYRTDPRKDYADGLFLSLTGDNKQPRLRDLAAELGGALADRVRRAEIFGG